MEQGQHFHEQLQPGKRLWVPGAPVYPQNQVSHEPLCALLEFQQLCACVDLHSHFQPYPWWYRGHHSPSHIFCIKRSQNTNLFLKSAFFCDLPQLSMTFIMLVGIGNRVIVRLKTTLPVSRSKHTWEPCQFPLGPREMQACVRPFMAFVTSASMLASMYSPNAAYKCLKLRRRPITISRGANLLLIPFAAGTAFTIIMKK